jgi:hypothetical protein
MGKKKPPLVGKRRTREHEIADLAVNHVERQVLLGRGTVERVQRDYGIDLFLSTYTPEGELESSQIYIQVKATERLKWLAAGGSAAFRLDRSDLVGWLRQLLPVILIVYDATADRAYWLHIQGHFASVPGFNLFTAGKTVTVYLDEKRVLDPASVRLFATLRDQAERRTDEE